MLLREGEEVEEDDEGDNGTMSGKWTVGILSEYKRERNCDKGNDSIGERQQQGERQREHAQSLTVNTPNRVATVLTFIKSPDALESVRPYVAERHRANR